MKRRIRRLEEKLSIQGKVPQEERIQVLEGSPEEIKEQIQKIEGRLLQQYGTTRGVVFLKTNINRRPNIDDFRYNGRAGSQA